MKKITLLLFIVLYSQSYSQSSLKRADKLYNTYAYTGASEAYKGYIDKTTEVNAEVYLKAADAYYFINNMRQAVMYYEIAIAKISEMEEPHLSRYVRSLRSVRDYEKADAVYLAYLEKMGDAGVIQRYKKEKEAFDAILNNEEAPDFTMENLEINSEYSDFAPLIYGDHVIFTSSRPGNAKELYIWNEQPYLSLFKAKKSETGQLSEPSLFAKQISSDFHDAAIAIIPDSKTIYYTSSTLNNKRLVLDEGNRNHFSIYKGSLIDDKVEGKESLFFSSTKYSTGHPSVNPDGTYLFFASDMPGGYGEADIYYCKIYEDGTLSTPQNAGPLINTSGNDFFPYLNGTTFYFSSNGHIGFGGLDLFEAEFSDGSFKAVKNMGAVMNTPHDDFGFVMNKDSQTGYMASNRPNGKGDDDIYFFRRKPKPCDQWITGTVIDKKSRETLKDVTMAIKDSLNNAVQTTTTDANGNYELKLPCNFATRISAAKEHYIEKTDTLLTGSVHNEPFPKYNFELTKIEDIIEKDSSGVEKIRMDPIFFEYDKWDITPEAALVLDKAVEVFKEIPDMRIKIEAHTDARGSDSYNLSLSDKRAKATQQYLYSKGIRTERIESATGFGESRLLNHCTNGIKCTNEDHDVNRRSDFIILKR